MIIHNYIEDLIKIKITQLIANRNDICKCDKCLSDMVAYAINGLPTIAYVTSDGGIHREVQNFTNDKLKIEIATRCIKAIEIVTKNPRHHKNTLY